MERLLALIALALLLYGVGRFERYYFSKPEVVARRVAKGKLPNWLTAAEGLTFIALYAAIGYGLVMLVVYLSEVVGHQAHPSGMALAPIVIVAFIPAMLFSNLIYWAIPYTRKIENENSRGVAEASFGEANRGLLKVALVVEPICILVSALGIFWNS
jgi:hypothetical protein